MKSLLRRIYRRVLRREYRMIEARDKTIAAKDKTIADCRNGIALRDTTIANLRERNATQSERIQALSDRIQDLRARMERQQKTHHAYGFVDGIAATLRPGDIVFDCGANVGKVSAALAASGATVHAFEPDPHALDLLRQRFADVPNVILHPVAVGDRDGEITFYRTAKYDDDPTHAALGSTVFAEHTSHQLNEMHPMTVPVVDFAAFLAKELEAGAKVPFVKIDIEGAELGLLRRMMDMGLLDRVGLTVAETHEEQLAHLAPDFAALRADVAARYPKNRVNLDWI